MVPLTDGAYGFDLAAFLRYVEACKLSGSESLAQIGYRPAGEWANRQAIPAALGDSYERGLVFHSLRHSLASLMQVQGVPTTHAQAVMGHATGTITFDVYGSGVPVETIAGMLTGLFNSWPVFSVNRATRPIRISYFRASRFLVSSAGNSLSLCLPGGYAQRQMCELAHGYGGQVVRRISAHLRACLEISGHPSGE